MHVLRRGATLFTAKWTFAASTEPTVANMSLVAVNLTVTAGDASESVYGLGQVSISVRRLECTPP
jgi:hypothetical protein